MRACGQSPLNELVELKGKDGGLDLLSLHKIPNTLCTKLRGGKVKEVKSLAQGYS